MKAVIAGGSGFLGRALAHGLAADSHEIVVLTRGPSGVSADPGVRRVQWTPDGTTGPWAAAIDGADAVVNLAGESIAARRWSDAQKRRIEDSRRRATRSLVDAIRGAAAPPPVFVSGSAVGYYGPCGDEIVTEQSPAGSDFLAHVCTIWEAEASGAASPRTRVAYVRTGLVLDPRGGALPRILLPFRFGAGGRLGDGTQYWPWIHLRDWVDLVRWTIATPAVVGPVNATAPNPVTNADFARHLGRALHRPALVPTPAFALRAMLGEMADGLLLSGQRAIPAKAQQLSFVFRFAQLAEALRDLVSAPRA